MRTKHLFLVAGILAGGAAARAQAPPSQPAAGPAILQPTPRPSQPPAPPAGDMRPSNPPRVVTRPSNLHILAVADHDLFARAFATAAHGDWTSARALAAGGQDATARTLLQWRYLLDPDSGAAFADIDAFLKSEPDWPLRTTLIARAEQTMPPEMSNNDVIAWFAGRDPMTSPGRIRLGDALVAAGQTDKGRELIRRGWILGSFDPATEQAIEQRDGRFFTPDTEDARLANLVWLDQLTAARRQGERAGPVARAVAEARIALLHGTAKAAEAAIAKVPAEGASDPNLLLDRATFERHGGHDAAAHRLLLLADPAPLASAHPERWWAEVNVEARDALDQGDAKEAYALVDHAGLAPGDQFADAEFLAGFIALRYLADAKTALSHFEKLDANVSRPISKSRAYYWEGRALEVLGDKAGAWRQYNLAATAPDTFYGQLAIARIDPAPLLHVADLPVDAQPENTLDADALVQPMRVLADLGEANLLRLFAIRDTDLHSEPAHVKRLMTDLTGWGYREIAVRIAKTASYAGASMLDFTHPVIPIPPYNGPGTPPDPALVLGIIRQETEFDPYAISSAGARGIMQVMSFTARNSARLAHIAYRPNDLLSDMDYNMQLGMIEIEGHLADWNGSIVLGAAAYNAGPRNAEKWVAAHGDPRAPGIDPVDWIERIPFDETRNYIERVLENTEVYRNRLAGHDLPLRILADLYAPGPPAAALLGYAPPASTPPVPAPRPDPATAAPNPAN